jgi:hypothetical protein
MDSEFEALFLPSLFEDGVLEARCRIESVVSCSPAKKRGAGLHGGVKTPGGMGQRRNPFEFSQERFTRDAIFYSTHIGPKTQTAVRVNSLRSTADLYVPYRWNAALGS